MPRQEVEVIHIQEEGVGEYLDKMANYPYTRGISRRIPRQSGKIIHIQEDCVGMTPRQEGGSIHAQEGKED